MPFWIHNRPAGFGVVHGPWESVLQGNPRGLLHSDLIIPDKCPVVNPGDARKMPDGEKLPC